MTYRSERRATAWAEMAGLAAAGLGELVEVSQERRKLVLHINHPRAALLTERPTADEFLRADEGSLLFRDAAPALIDAIPRQLLARRMNSAKGLEFRWTVLADDDIRLLHALVRWLARTGGSSPVGGVA